MSPLSRKLFAVSAALGLASNTACYAYAPLATGSPPTQADVRVTLNAAGTEELARYLGPRVRVADGNIASKSSDGEMTISVSWVQLANGSRQPWTGEGLVTFPKAYVAGVELRTLDRRRSYLAGAALTVALVGTVVLALHGWAGLLSSPTDADPGGPLKARTPAGIQPR